jgi:O-phosphoseryl-tRNA(Cys) synthetase
MDAGWALILSAVVTAVGGIIVTVIALFRKENQQDHTTLYCQHYVSCTKVSAVLKPKWIRVDSRVTDHLESHS